MPRSAVLRRRCPALSESIRLRGCDKKYKKPNLVQAVRRERVKNVQVLFCAWTYFSGVTGYASHSVTCGVGAVDQSAFPHDPLPGSPSRVANPQLLPFSRIWTKDRSPIGSGIQPLEHQWLTPRLISRLLITWTDGRRASVSIELKDGSTIRNLSQLEFLFYPKSHIFDRWFFSFVPPFFHSIDLLEMLALIHGYLWWYWWIIIYYSHSFKLICFVMSFARLRQHPCTGCRRVRRMCWAVKNRKLLVVMSIASWISRYYFCVDLWSGYFSQETIFIDYFGLLHKYRGEYMISCLLK